MLRQIDDVDEALAAVGIAVFATIVPQPDARELRYLAVAPLDRQRFRRRRQSHDPVPDAHGRRRRAADARAFNSSSKPAPIAASALTADNAKYTPFQPNATETRATLSPATTAPR